MKFSITLIFFSLMACAAEKPKQQNSVETVVWQADIDVEQFWLNYSDSKGGLTWPQSTEYPEYSQVKEGDTFMVEVEQGLCLMEFFHNRWRRANDVRRWDDSVNEYGGCPHVFD